LEAAGTVDVGVERLPQLAGDQRVEEAGRPARLRLEDDPVQAERRLELLHRPPGDVASGAPVADVASLNAVGEAQGQLAHQVRVGVKVVDNLDQATHWSSKQRPRAGSWGRILTATRD